MIPNSLKNGSVIALTCPAGGFEDYKPIDRTVKYLESLGYKVKLGKHLISSKTQYKYLSGTDRQRVGDFNRFAADKSVDAIFCMRGGYGTSRILNDIDYAALKKSKKIILGYSDITALLIAINSKTELVTFHGPMFGSKFLSKSNLPKEKSSAKAMWNVLKDENFKIEYKKPASCYVIKSGKVKGKLVGGNLTIFASLLGTEYFPNVKGKILFLEDCYEEPYKIDRLITQLENAKVFTKVKGILFTNFFKCGFKNNAEITKLLKDKLTQYKVPIVYGFPSGHCKKNYILPIGKSVTFDTGTKLLYN